MNPISIFHPMALTIQGVYLYLVQVDKASEAAGFLEYRGRWGMRSSLGAPAPSRGRRPGSFAIFGKMVHDPAGRY